MDLTPTPVTIFIAVITAFLSAYLAKKRGRNPIIWFLIGLTFGLLGLFSIFFFPSLKKGEKKGSVAPSKKAPYEEEALAPLPPTIVGPSDKFWYYLDPLNAQQGPMSFDALTRAFGQGKITGTTYVWHEDLSDWKPLQEFFNASP